MWICSSGRLATRLINNLKQCWQLSARGPLLQVKSKSHQLRPVPSGQTGDFSCPAKKSHQKKAVAPCQVRHLLAVRGPSGGDKNSGTAFPQTVYPRQPRLHRFASAPLAREEDLRVEIVQVETCSWRKFHTGSQERFVIFGLARQPGPEGRARPWWLWLCRCPG